MKVRINAYMYENLDNEAQFKAQFWLDKWPLDYKNESGETQFKYFSDMETQDIIEHCDSNGYLFDKYGNPIHHLITK